MTSSQWLTVRMIAEELNLKPDTVSRYLASGKIPGGTKALGQNWRVNPDTYKAWKDNLTSPRDPHLVAPRSNRSKAARKAAQTRHK